MLPAGNRIGNQIILDHEVESIQRIANVADAFFMRHVLVGKGHFEIFKYREIVFQSYHLIDNLTVFENLEVPLSYKNVPHKERVSRVCDALDRFNIVGKKDLFPNQLSGGQQQLVGVARAVIMNPKLILADEPTGNLHSAQGDEIMQLFKRLNDAGTTIIQVTHSERNASYGHRIIQLKDGWVVGETATADVGANAAQPG